MACAKTVERLFLWKGWKPIQRQIGVCHVNEGLAKTAEGGMGMETLIIILIVLLVLIAIAVASMSRQMVVIETGASDPGCLFTLLLAVVLLLLVMLAGGNPLAALGL